MRMSSSNAGSDSIDDQYVQLVKGGTPVGDSRDTSTDWPTTMTAANYGSTSDLWGTTWTPADINASNFGVGLTCYNESSSSHRTASVDYMQITVTYAYSQGPNYPSTASQSNYDAGGGSGDGSQWFSSSSSTTVGPNYPGTGSEVDHENANRSWSGTGNITSDNDVYASVFTTESTGDASYSEYLQATNFGFTIPGGATIVGIQVAIGRYASGGNIEDEHVRLITGGSMVGDDKQTDTYWPLSEGAANYGGASDDWGRLWTPAEVNAADFGVRLAIDSDTASDRTSYVDYIRVSVTYTSTVIAADISGDDSSYAFTYPELGTSGDYRYSDYLRATGFGFSIPGGAIIDGIEVTIEKRAEDDDDVYDVIVQLLKNGSLVGDNYARTWDDWNDDSWQVDDYGGPSDLWGTTWGAADINNANFGVALVCWNDAGHTNWARVDYMRITVYYTVAAVPLDITTTSLPNWEKNAPGYSQTLAATGGTPPYTWSITAGALPPGLTLTPATGLISGTPTTSGIFNFTATVTDSVLATDSQLLSITIGPYITTASPLPNADRAVFYTQTLTAVAGTPAYTWAKIAGSLPPGITLDPTTGVISGTINTYGTWAFTVRVTDSYSTPQTDTKAFSITVNGAIITVTSPNGSEIWAIGSVHAITWTCSTSFAAVGPNVNIYISRNGGLTWTALILSTPNDGSQLWVVTGPATTQALIKIVAMTYPFVYDVSDATFTIGSPPA